LHSKTRILVVDDEESIRTTMKAILEDEGYLVDLAADGKEAIEKANAKFYNLTLLDIRLPDMEGVELLKKIKDYVPRTRKIMVTGYPSLQNAVDALNKCADAYLIKPVDLEMLLKVVREQLQKQAEEKNFSEQKVAMFIETRVSEIKEDFI
jgi:two-component system, NtrC family, nitrogen regulation response regulator NtrX